MTKKTITPEGPATKPVKAEPPVAAKTSPAKPKRPATDAKASTPKPTVAKAAAKTPAKPVAAKMDTSILESIGVTAGSIWQHLDSNGATTVAKLVRELSEDEKTIQRGIGWLTREDKITLTVINRIETVALKG
ncbi:MAG: winged helix-turn-helix domain-containing protein [Methylococcaceae bacterium]|nr:winged helix-turn-helix domain-containing protein [Methylococcaceae bacterium]